MSIPRVQPLLLPVLRMTGDRNKHSVEEFRKRMIGNFKLPRKEVKQTHSKSDKTCICEPCRKCARTSRHEEIRSAQEPEKRVLPDNKTRHCRTQEKNHANFTVSLWANQKLNALATTARTCGD